MELFVQYRSAGFPAPATRHRLRGEAPWHRGLRKQLEQLQAREASEIVAMSRKDEAREAKMKSWEAMAASIAASVDMTTKANERRMQVAEEEHQRKLEVHLRAAADQHKEALKDAKKQHAAELELCAARIQSQGRVRVEGAQGEGK